MVRGMKGEEKAADSSAKSSSHLNVHPNGPSYASPMMPIDTDDGISYKGLSKNLVSSNFSAFEVNATSIFQLIHENVSILCKAWENILAILNDLNDMPEFMKQMPPLLVMVNEELANSILPRPPHQMKS
ncbi:hypothetical protein EUTSA_v10029444mg [Eutrema salsugineum]|uniref:Uncharacterized protein n=1 Tax=Eutrema salsugineum TaxID=72664 RepID=V4L2P3_EUTSA|nr:hypothetical protein EUTSA_v10029444mg [Eutrema salsugineum]